MEEMTLLAEEQVCGINRLNIIKKYGRKCEIKDFAILLGGYVSDDYYTDEGTSLKYRTGWWWTRTPYDNDARAVNSYGNRSWCDVYERRVGARPALPYSSISSISSN